jgi:hypothetical protein
MTTRLRFVIGVFLVALVSTVTIADQAQELNRVMREKLDRSKAILGAVVTSDWALLDRESRALALVTRDPAWVVLTDPEYLRQSDAFAGSLQKLIEASSQRDLDAAATAEVSLTMSCVQCHKYMARRRIARSGRVNEDW